MKYIKYKEQKTHGTFDFPLEFYRVGPSHPRYQMSYHWHIEYEIIRIVEGELDLTVDAKEICARKGDIVFLQEGVLHGGIPHQCIYECIVFNLSSLLKHETVCKQPLQMIINQEYTITNLYPAADDEFHMLVNGLCDTLKSKYIGYELSVLGSLYQLFSCILKNHLYKQDSKRSKQNTKRILQLKNAIELIETSYGDCLTLEDLSTAAGMNSKYFCRFFHEMTHRTPIDYLNYYRIECACIQLATTDHTITEVALTCGYNDVSYFIKTFKKYKGITPKQYLNSPL